MYRHLTYYIETCPMSYVVCRMSHGIKRVKQLKVPDQSKHAPRSQNISARHSIYDAIACWKS